jgi:hypothetical protein
MGILTLKQEDGAPTPSVGYAKLTFRDGLVYFMKEDGSEILLDGSPFLSIPAFNGGTSGVDAPFTVDSTFLVTNLNAEFLGSKDLTTVESEYQAYTDSEITTLIGTAGVTRDTLGELSDAIDTKLDATAKADDSELLDGLDSLQFLRSDVDDTFDGNLDVTGNLDVQGYISGPAVFTIDPAGVGDNTGKVVIAGDLQVDGTTTTINSTTLEVTDLTITVAKDATIPSEANGAGIEVDGASASFTYHSASDSWRINKRLQDDLGNIYFKDGDSLDADTLDGVQGANYMRLDKDNKFSDNDFLIQANTTDGSDTSLLRIAGGGSALTANSGARIQLAGNENIEFTGRAQIISGNVAGGNIELCTVGSQHILFQTNNTERARINSAGSLLLGTTNTELHVNTTDFGFAYLNGNGAQRLATNHLSTALITNKVNYVSGATNHIQFRENGAIRGSITSDGSSTSYNTSSDYRLKENVTDLTGATDRLTQIPVHRFNFITNPDRTVDGFLAHEVQAVIPEAVTGEKDAVDEDGNPEYQAIDQSKLVPLLTAALQEALTEINNLKTRVTALETV